MKPSLSRRPSSPAVEPPPLENDDLLDKIIIRLPPLPSSLPRASAVCKRWRGLVSDPRFVRRFRAHHRRNHPLLGFFVSGYHNLVFQPILDAPNRIPQDRFSLPIDVADGFLPLGCRHGLMLFQHSSENQLLVWDPITGDQHRLDIPPWFDTKNPFSAAVLRAAGEVHHFQVVLVGNNGMQHTQAAASVYSSETRVWGNLITSEDFRGYVPNWVYLAIPPAMVGGSLYWLLTGNSSYGMLEFDLDRQSLGFIPMPGKETLSGGTGYGGILVLTEGGGLGFLFESGFSAQLWKRETDCDGGASWVIGRTIALDKLLSINSKNKRENSFILGFAEENNVVLLRTSIGIFTVQLESLQFKKLSQPFWHRYYPFEGVYTAATGNGGGHDGAELLQNI